MNNILKHIRLLLACGFISLFTACAVHQWPEPNDEPGPDGPVLPEVPETDEYTVNLNLVFEPTFYLWEHKYDPILGTVEEQYPEADYYPGHTGTTSSYDNTRFQGTMLVDFKVFSQDANMACVAEQSYSLPLGDSGYDHTVQLTLPDKTGKYVIAAWSQLKELEQQPPYYNTADFQNISLISEHFEANTEYRDAFSDTIHVNMDRKEALYAMTMTRPLGKYELVTTDLSEFLDKETERRMLPSRASADDYTVKITHVYYYPSAYSVMQDELRNVFSSWSFTTGIVVTGDSEASIGSDYFLESADGGGAQIMVEVYDSNNEKVASTPVFTAPVVRDRHTLLRGAFLSMEGHGGVGIDPDYEGDHNLTIP